MRLLFLSATLALASCSWQPAIAQTPQCGVLTDVAQALERDWGEVLVFTGSTPDSNIVLLFLNSSTGSWTLATTVIPVAPQDYICLVGDGVRGKTDFEAKAPPNL